jgi:hypothetical protein
MSSNLPNWLEGERVVEEPRARAAPPAQAQGVYVTGGQHEVVVTNIQMPFASMVVFILKFAIASIPAMMILAILNTLIFGSILAFLWLMGLSRMAGQ